jgi:hypothetical protein
VLLCCSPQIWLCPLETCTQSSKLVSASQENEVEANQQNAVAMALALELGPEVANSWRSKNENAFQLLFKVTECG